MKRRACLAAPLAAVPTFGAPRSALAQARRLRRIGFLRATTPQHRDFAVFVRALVQHGWQPGTNVEIEQAHAAGDPARLPALAADLAARGVEVLVVDGDLTARAAAQAAPRTPVVFTLVTDPVRLGFAASLAAPGGLMTGQTGVSLDLTAKRVDLLRETLPRAERFAVLVQPGPTSEAHRAQVEASARRHGLLPSFRTVASAVDLADALDWLGSEHNDAVFTLYSPLFYSQRARIVARLNALRLPGMHPEREFVTEGGLLAYGASFEVLWTRAAYFVDRLLRGARAAELPVQVPTAFDLAVNQATARHLGIELPVSVLAAAQEVIE